MAVITFNSANDGVVRSGLANDRIMWLWGQKLDTKDIAKHLKCSEAAVANQLARLRDRNR